MFILVFSVSSFVDDSTFNLLTCRWWSYFIGWDFYYLLLLSAYIIKIELDLNFDKVFGIDSGDCQIGVAL